MNQHRQSHIITGLSLLSVIIGAGFYFYSVTHRTVYMAATTTPVNLTSVTYAANTIKRVGIQIGHYQIEQLPAELSKIQYDTGTQAADGTTELSINTDLALKVASILQQHGIAVDILPATVPENYLADAFVALHVDGNDYSYVNGYKVAGSSFDSTNKSSELAQEIFTSYASTGLSDDSADISQDMSQYYAFNYQKYAHTVSTATPSAIVETGYITNSGDESYLTNHSQAAAQAIATGILTFLNVH